MVALEKKDEPALVPGPAPDGTDTSDIDAVRIPHITIEVFRETEAFAHVWEQVAADRRLVSATTMLEAGGFPAAIRKYASSTTPSLIIVETDSSDEVLQFETDALAEVCDPDTHLIIVGHRNDIALYQKLLVMGVSSYLVYPVTVASVITAISQVYAEPGKEKIGRVTAVIGANGGAGASTVAHNVAAQVAAQAAADTLLVDMDVDFGTASLALDVEPNQGLSEVVEQAERLDTGMLDRVVIRRGLHLNLLTTSHGIETDRALDPVGVERLLDVATLHIPHTVLDMPMVWSDWSQRALVGADEVLIVAEPELASLRNAAVLISRLKALRPNDRPPKLVLNKIGVPRREEVSARDVAQVLQIEPFAVMPFDPKALSKAPAHGKLVTEVAARRPVARALANMAQDLQPKKGQARAARRRSSRWRR